MVGNKNSIQIIMGKKKKKTKTIDMSKSKKKTTRIPRLLLVIASLSALSIFSNILYPARTNRKANNVASLWKPRYDVPNFDNDTKQSFLKAVPRSAHKGAAYIIAKEKQQKSKVRFIMTIGLEGTGHHMLKAFLKGSPVIQELSELGIHPELTGTLVIQLFNHKKSSGLWNAHCKQPSTRSKGRNVRLTAATEPNVKKYLEDVVNILQTINQKAAAASLSFK